MTMDVGPFRFYRSQSGSLDISLICIDHWPCGFEYGWRDAARGQDRPWLDLRVGKLQIVYFEPFNSGIEVWLLGFWAIMTWGHK